MKVTGSTIQQLEKDKPRSRCRKWRLWATTDEGRRSRRFTGTYTQASDALSALVAELEGQVPNPETFGAYAASWALWRAKSGDLAPGTVENDRRNVAALRRSPLDGVRMDEITPEACRDALLWIKGHPARGDGELSNTTMNKVHVCLNAILQQAEDDGKVSANPMRRVRAPRPDTAERDALAPDELSALLDRVDALPLDGRVMAVYLMACLGLRRGEACALLDSDVRGGMCEVHLAVKERDGRAGEPKSKAGVRTLPVPPRLQRKVDEWRAARRDAGLADAPTLCCNTRGGVLRPQLLQRWWTGDSAHNGVAGPLGCGGMTLHQLRHSNLSMVARYMSPFDLQRYAGWSSIEPARVYIHDDLESVKRAVSAAWECIDGASDAPKTHQDMKKGQGTRP